MRSAVSASLLVIAIAMQARSAADPKPKAADDGFPKPKAVAISPEAVKGRLDKALKEYDSELEKFRADVAVLLDKREAAARTDGNKAAVDRVKAERKAFAEGGELPPMLPPGLRQQVPAARAKLDKAYAAAIADYVRAKDDDAAAAVEKERAEFQASTSLLSKRAFLTTLKPFDIRSEHDEFADNGTRSGAVVRVGGQPVPHSIYLHPPRTGVSQVSYTVGGKWTVFRAVVGIPPLDKGRGNPDSKLTYEVLGDGKSLWRSKPVTTVGDFQKCEVRIADVKVLTLRVHCPGNNAFAQTFWIEPLLIVE